MEKPDVDLIEGLSPAIAIEQKAASHNPRSTVGTVTEIHDYLRLLYARVGTPYCPEHGIALEAQTVTQMVDHVLALPEDTKLMILAPVVAGRKGEQADLFEELRAQGFTRVRVDGKVHELDQRAAPGEERQAHGRRGDRPAARQGRKSKQRLAESFETALRHADGRALVVEIDNEEGAPVLGANSPARSATTRSPSSSRACSRSTTRWAPARSATAWARSSSSTRAAWSRTRTCRLASGAIKGWDRRNQFYYSMLTSLAGHFGFDVEAPWEMLDEATQKLILHGSGKEKIAFRYLTERGRSQVREHAFEGVLPEPGAALPRDRFDGGARGTRQVPQHAALPGLRAARACGARRATSRSRSRTIFEVSALPLRQGLEFFKALKLAGAKQQIAERIVREIANRLEFLVNVGLDYLALDRAAGSLSGGESQRIRLASQIGSGLTGVMYVLDEPSIGLHQRDNARLIETLKHLRDLGNSVVVVEHDEEAIRAADYVVDMGPGAGRAGGEIVAEGTPAQIIASPDSLTGKYLAHALSIAVPRLRNRPGHQAPHGARGDAATT